MVKTPKVRTKICGITNAADARRAVAEGAEFLGFNFYEKSPRYIRPGAAERIARSLPARVKKAGVFVNESEETIARIARRVGLDFIQLHGEESPAFVARIRRVAPVIKAVRVRPGFRTAELRKYANAAAVLLDGFDSRRHGGTGKTFDWRIAKRAGRGRRIFLAGGLTPENVGEAVRAVHPFAVDVCSGVESRPGKKSAARMKELMKAVREAQGRKK
ncbi:MAG TPA: phosphoribosylanthranilate isomerase [Candidatus Acidoferrum sp.]|nr:phosphoribosylanthranilate isomerase [Candidatus Acidoferrum sp.]